ncbi:MAG: CRTAC1 family protein [Deltaproteobacteria bacterium]|nr:CRTAC1 family protein [Deltaproteobacteria bacterium]
MLQRTIHVCVFMAGSLLVMSFPARPHGAVTFTDIASTALPKVMDLRTFGVCVTDYDKDGLEDIYIINHLTTPALLRNKGNSTFSFETLKSGIAVDRDFHGCSWADYDEDADPDLYQTVGAVGGTGTKSNYLYRNSNGVFTDIAASTNVSDPEGRGRSAGWFDFDNDGDLDIFVVNSLRTDAPNTLFRNNGNSTFTEIARSAGVADSVSGEGLSFSDYNNDGFMDIFVTSSQRVFLYRNNAGSGFSDVTQGAGLTIIKNARDSAWADFDNDGDMDLFITSAKGLGDAVYADSGLIAFETREKKGADTLSFTSDGQNTAFDLYLREDRADKQRIFIGRKGAHPRTVPFTLGVSSSIDPLGKPENVRVFYPNVYLVWQDESGVWYVSNEARNADANLPYIFRGFITSDGNFLSHATIGYEPKPETARNYLFKNTGGIFTDITGQAGLSDTRSGQSALWADFDNDSDLDLYIVKSGDVLNEPNSLYLNNGNGTFTESQAGAEAFTAGNGESASLIDMNNDGFMDIVVTNGLDLSAGPYVFLRNNGNSNKWVKIRLIGRSSNRDAVGARVVLKTATKTLVREQNSGAHLRSQNSQVIHFGLGSETIVSLTIYWPSGARQTLYNLDVNRLHEVTETL